MKGQHGFRWVVALAFALVIGAAVAGCGTQRTLGDYEVVEGRRFDPQQVDVIEDGVTSDNQVYELFGQPLERREQGNKEILIYRFVETKRDETSGFLKSESEELKYDRTLKIVLKDGIVQEHEYNERRTRTTESNRF